MKIILCTLLLSCSLMAEQDVTFHFESGVTVYCGKEEVPVSMELGWESEDGSFFNDVTNFSVNECSIKG